MYTAKSDVYSYGVLLWELFSAGATPYGDMTAVEAFRAVCAGHRLPRPHALTNDAVVQLIRDTTRGEVALRPSMSTVRHTLKELFADSRVRGDGLPLAQRPRVGNAAFVSNPAFASERTAWVEIDSELETTEL